MAAGQLESPLAVAAAVPAVITAITLPALEVALATGPAAWLALAVAWLTVAVVCLAQVAAAEVVCQLRLPQTVMVGEVTAGLSAPTVLLAHYPPTSQCPLQR